MSSERPTEELVNRLLAAAAAGAADGVVDELIDEAVAEARAEVKDLVRSTVTAALLRQAAARLEERGLAHTGTVKENVPRREPYTPSSGQPRRDVPPHARAARAVDRAVCADAADATTPSDAAGAAGAAPAGDPDAQAPTGCY